MAEASLAVSAPNVAGVPAPTQFRPLRRGAAVLGLLLAAGGILGACSSSGAGLARQSCQHVQRSLQIFARAQEEVSPKAASAERAAALQQLRLALPLAALASTDSGTWDPLATTLSESSRVPEGNLVHALQAECTSAFG